MGILEHAASRSWAQSIVAFESAPRLREVVGLVGSRVHLPAFRRNLVEKRMRSVAVRLARQTFYPHFFPAQKQTRITDRLLRVEPK